MKFPESFMRMVSLRAWLLLGFVIAMPVLALPPVARRVDELLYGPPPTDFGRPGETPPLQDPIPGGSVEQVAPVTYLTPATAGEYASDRPDAGPRGLDAPGPIVPALAAAPEASPVAPAQAQGGAVPVNEQTIARLHEIRQRLERLGADYIIVETTDGGGGYRFHCRMLLDGNTRVTRPFEATSSDPLAAGEEVLQAVEAWRRAGQTGVSGR